MKRIFVIVSLMILFEFACHAQRVYSKQNLEHASLESLISSLEKAQKLKKQAPFCLLPVLFHLLQERYWVRLPGVVGLKLCGKLEQE